MSPLNRIIIAIVFSLSFFASSTSYALKASGPSTLPSVLKADDVEGDKITNSLTATGNVELSKGSDIVYADKMIYDKGNGWVRAIGNVKIKNIEVGNVKASNAEIKDDFSKGIFFDSTIILKDGSYLVSPKIDHQTPEITVLKSSIYSLCPNPDIAENNDKAGQERDMLSIKSKQATIDKGNGSLKMNSGVVRFYNVPFLYTPILKVPLPSKKRQSGFLYPSYAKSTRLGVGFKIPYYWNIAPNKDLTITPYLNTNANIISNEFRHMLSYGEYKTTLEVSDNRITTANDTAVVNRTQEQYRWYLIGDGKFDFTKDIGLDFVINNLGDRNYLRDYHTTYLNYSLSKVNVDYIHGRDYYSAKTIKIQELENITTEKNAPLILPALDYHIESNPGEFKQKYIFTSNATVITREEGLQYRRLTMIPEANLPVNIQGNLFNFDAKVQTDLYSLDNNLKNSSAATNIYNSTQTNYKPEFSASWRLPLLKKLQSNTILIEPMINFVSSSYKKNFQKVPNEDSNNSELTMNNLFTSDRINGFDRNESGQRITYGAKSSLFNSYGKFGLMLGQSIKKGSGQQDVTIRGFNDNNKSNIVGQFTYDSLKHFNISYAFHLNESNYRNEINEINTNLNFERFTLSSNYLLLRKNNQNPDKREQITSSMTFKMTNKITTNFSITENIVTKRILSRSIGINRDGCCTVFGFSITESNPTNLVKPQQSFNINLTFKNL